MKVKDLVSFLSSFDDNKEVKIWYPGRNRDEDNPIIYGTSRDLEGNPEIEIGNPLNSK